jgi:hypothetical protein
MSKTGSTRSSGARLLLSAFAIVLAATVATVTGPGAGPAAAEPSTPAYVAAVYQLFLERPPSPEESERWVRQLAAGTPRSALTHALARSEEWAGTVIRSLYRDALGRAPDPAGYSYWLDLVLGGTHIRVIAVAVFGSDEAYRRAGATAEGFVDYLYRTVLMRGPDPEGLRYWTSVLDRGVTPVEVVDGFRSSVEFRRQRVHATYRDVLGRDPDPEGLRYWADQLQRFDEVDLAAFLAASEEFWLRTQRSATRPPAPPPEPPARDTDGDGIPDADEIRWGTDPERFTGADCWALVQRYGPWDPDARTPQWPVNGGDYSGRDLRGCGHWLPRDVTIRDVNFAGARLDDNFLGRMLQDVDFRGASMTGCRLGGDERIGGGGSLGGLDLTGADLTGCRFDGARFRAGDLLDGAIMRRTTWSTHGEYLAGIFDVDAADGLDLRDAGGDWVHFPRTDLSTALVERARFERLVCPSQAVLEGPAAVLADCPPEHNLDFSGLDVALSHREGRLEVTYTWDAATPLWLRVELDGTSVHVDPTAWLDGPPLGFAVDPPAAGEHVLTLIGEDEVVSVVLHEHRFTWPLG